MRPYADRAAALVLLWTETLDDVEEAERCATPDAFAGRLEAFRQELRDWLVAHPSPADSPEKWVQRAFFSDPPKRGALREPWRDVLLAWVRSTGLGPEARQDLELGVRALFADGADADAELARRRPRLADAVAGSQRAPVVNVSGLAAPLVLDDLWYPAYLTDPNLERVVWCNRSFRAFLGIAPDRARGLTLGGILALYQEMLLAEHQDQFQSRQSQVLEAGRMVGRGLMTCVVDLSRRTWTAGVPTPPWEGRYHVTAHAHVLVDDATGVRIGSVCVWVPVPFARD